MPLPPKLNIVNSVAFKLNGMRNYKITCFRLSFQSGKNCQQNSPQSETNMHFTLSQREMKTNESCVGKIFRVRCRMKSLNLDLSTIRDRGSLLHISDRIEPNPFFQLMEIENPLEDFHYASRASTYINKAIHSNWHFIIASLDQQATAQTLHFHLHKHKHAFLILLPLCTLADES